VASPDPSALVFSYIILKSSTSGSKKKFRITVDDNGVLTTKEVTE
jgi:hypothetical protein